VVTLRRKERRRNVEGERIKEMRAGRSLAGSGRRVRCLGGQAALLRRVRHGALRSSPHVSGASRNMPAWARKNTRKNRL
jgi:hypothetical protein